MGTHTTTKRAQYSGGDKHNHNHEEQKDSRRRPTSRDAEMQWMDGGGGMNERESLT
jgi:hypothetical protein